MTGTTTMGPGKRLELREILQKLNIYGTRMRTGDIATPDPRLVVLQNARDPEAIVLRQHFEQIQQALNNIRAQSNVDVQNNSDPSLTPPVDNFKVTKTNAAMLLWAFENMLTGKIPVSLEMNGQFAQATSPASFAKREEQQINAPRIVDYKKMETLSIQSRINRNFTAEEITEIYALVLQGYSLLKEKPLTAKFKTLADSPLTVPSESVIQSVTEKPAHTRATPSETITAIPTSPHLGRVTRVPQPHEKRGNIVTRTWKSFRDGPNMG